MSKTQRMVESGTLLFEQRHTQTSDQRRPNFKHEVSRFNLKTTRFRTRSTFLIPTDFCLRSPHTTFRRIRKSRSQPNKSLQPTAAPLLRSSVAENSDARRVRHYTSNTSCNNTTSLFQYCPVGP